MSYRRNQPSLFTKVLWWVTCWLFGLMWAGIRKLWYSKFPKHPCSAPSQKAIDEFYNKWRWHKISYRKKKEAGWRCNCCGKSRNGNPKLVIVTDHIKPIRHYWHLRWDENNMQVLCQSCNRGKGSWDETDFREFRKPGWVKRLWQEERKARA